MLRGRLLLLLLLVAAPSTTHAASVAIQSVGFDGTFDALSVKRFDPALGTLDSVGVTISGVLTVSGIALQFPMVPLPATFVVTVDQAFDGLGGDFFDFGSPARFVLNGMAPDALFTLISPFSYSFSVTSASDVVGFVIPGSSGPTVPPITVNAHRSDFVGNPAVPGLITLTHAATALPVFSQPPVLSSTSSRGVLILEYRYTPATPPSVPEPATTWLLAAGLGLAARRRLAGRRVA